MAKKNNDGESTNKSNKRTATPGAKRVAKPKQTSSTASPKPPISPKQTSLPRSKKVAGDQLQKVGDKKFVVHGQVLYADKKPAIDVKVVAFDQDIAREDLLGEATTDQGGHYQITYSESQFRRTDKEIGGADLIVRVYSAEGKVMAQSKRKRNASQEEIVNLTVSSEESFTVSGTIYGSDTRPRAGALVRVYDQDLRNGQLLGEAKTDTEGRYNISYIPPKFLQAEKRSADLRVVVVDMEGKELTSSRVLFNAPAVAAVNLTLPMDGQTLSEFELLLEDILPLLAGQGKDGADLNVAELEDKDIVFLSQETSQPQERIAFLVAAVKAVMAAGELRLPSIETHAGGSRDHALPVEAFYGWFRQGLPTDLDQLLHQSGDLLRGALVASLHANIIPAALGDALDSILTRLQQLAVERLLKPGEPNGKASLGDLLSTILPDPQKQHALASLFLSYPGTSEAFWQALKAAPEFNQAEIGQIQVTLQLGTLTGYYLPLVCELQHMGQEDLALNEVRGFARLELKDWENILRSPQENGQPIGFPADVLGEDESAKITNYAQKLSQYIENTFPTAVIAHRLEKDDQVDSPFSQTRNDFKTFFANNPAFEFGTTAVGLYLSQDRDKRLKGVKQPVELTLQLKNMQRVFKLTPHFEQINALLADNLHSSQAIVHMGKRAFVEKHSETFGGEELAITAYILAEHVHLTALTLYARHSVVLNSPVPYVIGGDPADRMNKIALRSKTTPDLRTLFGSLDLCDCEHCMSLYSPSAYLVDTLKYLNDGPRKDGKTPLDILLERRPDIADLELTCENTNTPLPYVDLVEEVLANFIAPLVPQTIPIPAGRDPVADLDGHNLPVELENAFEENAMHVSGHANITTIKPGQEWGIEDAGYRWTVQYSPFPPQLELSRNGLSPVVPVANLAAALAALNNCQLPAEVQGQTSPRQPNAPANPTFEISIVQAGLKWQLTRSYQWTITQDDETYTFDSSAGQTVQDFESSDAYDLDQGSLPWDILTFLDGVNSQATVSTVQGGLEWQVILQDQWDIQYKADTLNIISISFQTSGTPDELNANPEHTNPKAYDQLRQAVYPWSLPFNLGREEARTYLNHLGVQGPEVMEMFYKGTPLAALTNAAITREYLGLSIEEARIIDGTLTGDPSPVTTNPGAWNFWGLLQSGNDMPDPADGTAPHVTGDWEVVLKHVSVFLQQTGLSYKELLELLGAYFINPVKSNGKRTLSLVAINEDENGDPVDPATCALDKLRIEGLNVLILEKTHRFVRLWRKLGWTIRDLDKAITAFNPQGLNDGFLAQLAHIQRLCMGFKVPLANMLSWWAAIDTASYIDHLAGGQSEVASLYQQLFRNKTVINPLDEAFTEDAHALSGNLSDHLPALVAALGIGAADLSLLTTGAAAVATDNNLNLANLSRLYRVASFTRALKLSIRDYLSIQELSGSDPFAAVPATVTGPSITATGASATLRFVEMTGTIRASGFSIKELDYLLQHDFTPSDGIAPAEDTIAATLDEIRSELQKIAAENTVREDPDDPGGVTTDPSGELTRKKLALLNWDSALIEEVIATLNGAVTYEDEVQLTPQEMASIVLPNDTGNHEVSLAALPPGFTFPDSLNGAVTYEATRLFAVDARIASELNQGNIPTDLSDKFRDPLVPLTNNANLSTQANGWKIVDGNKRYSIVNGESVLIVYDETDKKLKASRRLTQPERALLLTASPQPSPLRVAVQALFVLQDELQGQISYDPASYKLRFIGPMTQLRQTRLKSASTDLRYQSAIHALFNAPRTIIARYMRTFSVQDFATDISAALATQLASVTFPNALKSKVYFDAAANPKQLHFIGVMTEQQREVLINLANNFSDSDKDSYGAAIEDLFAQPVALSNDFLTVHGQGNDAAGLFDNATTAAERFLLVLKKLLLYLQRMLSERLVVQKMAEALKLEAKTARDLLTKWVNSPTDPAQKSLTEFLAPVFAESNLNVNLTSAAFPAQFNTFMLLHKIATLVTRFKVTPGQLAWLFDYGPGAGWLDLNTLPLSCTGSASVLFAGWERLVHLFRLRDQLPRGESVLSDVFSMARDATLTQASLLQKLSDHTGWTLDNLQFLVGVEGLNLTFPDAYKDERALARLLVCFKLMKRLGASARQLGKWGKPNQTTAEELDNARSIKNVVKAKYDDTQWLAVAKPLRDSLREKQRAALVAYLVTHPDPAKGQTWSDVDGLYEYFLIDVEMAHCMMTTRLKQAINSVQLFIQRCLMNLEPDVSLNPEEAKEWHAWRKQYRIWEANRKVFLYPENWIEPELRDDKSPFFKDLENELLQNDVTMDTVETAFLHYLGKLDAVARLEIVGIYQQKEEATGDERAVDILHVFGRTFDTPHVYHYRKQEQSVWSAWEKVDLDIEGDHLIPVVWNRRLYLFWPVFTEKTLTPTEPEKKAGADPKKYWEIQIAWGEYKNNKWSAKKVTDLRIKSFIPLSNNADSAFGRWSHIFRTDLTGTDLILLIRNAEQTFNLVIDEQDAFRFGESNGDSIKVKRSNYVQIKPLGTQAKAMTYRGEDKLYLEDIRAAMYKNVLVLDAIPNPGAFQIMPHHTVSGQFDRPLFFQDYTRTFFITRMDTRYFFRPFFHPYTREFLRQLSRHGIDGLLDPKLNGELPKLRRQLLRDEFFNDSLIGYKPTGEVAEPYPVAEVEFNDSGAYSLYNWELFFHAPFLIANQLSRNQRFEEAQKWFHYIFDPTSSESGGKERFWKVKPFYEEAEEKKIQTLDDLMKETKALDRQIEKWRENPFKPHVIARLRHVAYMKAVVMKYIDNLIAWGDQLFRRDTIESINEATQLYILAAHILGRRPDEIPARATPQTQTFASLTSGQVELNAFSKAMVEIEQYIFPSTAPNGSSSSGTASLGLMPLFCAPKNDRLLGYWSTVADRLFKIRHCMNIEGVARQLPIFEPPIDPALLVRAAAAGVDISSALNDINAALPHYRFNIMLQKATELCNDVKALGAALLSALEKRDAEVLALLRSGHEIKLLNAVQEVRKQQVNEAEETLDGLRKAKLVTEARRDYYRDIVHINPNEQLHMDSLGTAHVFNEIAQGINASVSAAHLIPNFDVGTAGWAASPMVKASFGGNNLGSALQATAGALSMIATQYTHDATMASIKGSYDRRWDDWKLQERLANKEVDQIDKQILAAEIRKAIAEYELQNHDLQVENAKEVDAFMHDKYTNQELYEWMVGQLSGIYFQSYQMAYDIAKRAERAFRHELGLSDSNFVQFGYWDSLKKGLLAGEKLHYDLKRMDVAYLDQNKREYEITKHISLSQIDSLALVSLKSTGACEISLPELLFDMDYPGHYLRRIKSVSLTIACVTGPYTGVNCTLTLLKSSVRLSNHLASSYQRDLNSDDNRFADTYGAIQSIVTSSAQNDAGLFEPNLRDERYLPCEFAGVISDWRLELPQDFNYFDLNTISDVVIHLRYTAREGGDNLGDAAASFVRGTLPTLGAQVFDLRRQFASAWQKFLLPAAENGDHELVIDLTNKDLFPFFVRNRTVKVESLLLFAEMDADNGEDYMVTIAPLQSSLPFTRTGLYGQLHSAKYTAPPAVKPDVGRWIFKIKKQGASDFTSLAVNEIKNLVMVISFKTE